MNEFFSFIGCCNPNLSNSNETLINHIPTQKINTTPKSNKVLEQKINKKNINNSRNNTIENIPETSVTNENISPRFLYNGEIDDNVSKKSSNDKKKKLLSSIISFSNFPIQPIIEEKEKGIIGPKILLSGELFFGKELIITTNGMINGLRHKNDGLTFFGLKNITDYRGTYYNDFVINYQIDNEELKKKNESSTGRVFNLCFQKKTKDFCLYMIHDSIIIYYEINNYVYFNNDKDYYLLLGNTFITIITKKNNKENTPKEIEIEIENENENGKNDSYNFTQNDIPITIGRSDCKICISQPSISKIHGVIDFSKECNLFYYKDSESTNGSILLVKEDDYLRIKGEMNFKLENIPFKIMELP